MSFVICSKGSSGEHGFVRFFNNSSAKLAIQHLQQKENNPVGLVVNIAGHAYKELKKVKESKKVETKVSKVAAGNPSLLNGESLVRIDGIGESHLASLLTHMEAFNLTNIMVSRIKVICTPENQSDFYSFFLTGDPEQIFTWQTQRSCQVRYIVGSHAGNSTAQWLHFGRNLAVG